MASSLTSTLTPTLKSPFCPKPIPKFTSHPVICSLWSSPAKPMTQKRTHSASSAIKAMTLDFAGSFFDRNFDDDDDDEEEEPPSPLLPVIDPFDEERQEPECPPGLRAYESMVVLRPDMSEDQRLTLTQKYEEMLVAGGGMYVEVFNRGVIPLSYEIRTRNRDGEANTYLDGIYLLFTFFTKPENIVELTEMLNKDDDVIRSSTFKVVKRKKWEYPRRRRSPRKDSPEEDSPEEDSPEEDSLEED